MMAPSAGLLLASMLAMSSIVRAMPTSTFVNPTFTLPRPDVHRTFDSALIAAAPSSILTEIPLDLVTGGPDHVPQASVAPQIVDRFYDILMKGNCESPREGSFLEADTCESFRREMFSLKHGQEIHNGYSSEQAMNRVKHIIFLMVTTQGDSWQKLAPEQLDRFGGHRDRLDYCQNVIDQVKKNLADAHMTRDDVTLTEKQEWEANAPPLLPLFSFVNSQQNAKPTENKQPPAKETETVFKTVTKEPPPPPTTKMVTVTSARVSSLQVKATVLAQVVTFTSTSDQGNHPVVVGLKTVAVTLKPTTPNAPATTAVLKPSKRDVSKTQGTFNGTIAYIVETFNRWATSKPLANETTTQPKLERRKHKQKHKGLESLNDQWLQMSDDQRYDVCRSPTTNQCHDYGAPHGADPKASLICVRKTDCSDCSTDGLMSGRCGTPWPMYHKENKNCYKKIKPTENHSLYMKCMWEHAVAPWTRCQMVLKNWPDVQENWNSTCYDHELPGDLQY